MLNVFQIHGATLSQSPQLQQILQAILETHQPRWKRISDMIHYTWCLLDYCKP
jgi:hypothetical protein